MAKIEAHEDNTGFAPRDSRYTAIDADSYDGALDAGALAQCTGWGATPEEAIANYWENHNELVEEAADLAAGRGYGPSLYTVEDVS